MNSEAIQYLTVNPGEYIVEIGAGVGETTVELLKFAKANNAKVIVIDPFGGEMPEGYRYSFDEFTQRTEPFKDYLIHIKNTSLSDEADIALSQIQIGFAFVDGLQYKGAVLNDLRITDHARVVCVDDYNRETGQSQVPAAIREYMKTSNKKLTVLKRCAILTR